MGARHFGHCRKPSICFPLITWGLPTLARLKFPVYQLYICISLYQELVRIHDVYSMYHQNVYIISVRSISGQTRKLVTRHVKSTIFVYSLALASLLQQRRRLQGLAASMPVPHAGGATGWVWLRVEHMVHGFYHIFGVSGNKKQQILAWILWDLASLWQWIKQLLHLNKNCLGWLVHTGTNVGSFNNSGI